MLTPHRAADQYVNGQMYAGMVVCEFVLADEGPGDGGLAVVQGSHKSNVMTPGSMSDYSRLVTEVNTKKGAISTDCSATCCVRAATHPTVAARAGDCVIFCEVRVGDCVFFARLINSRASVRACRRAYMGLFLGAASTKGAWCCIDSIQVTARTHLGSLSLTVRCHCTMLRACVESGLVTATVLPLVIPLPYADPDWFFDLDEEQRAVLQQPASRGRGDIMASDQMKGSARL